MMTCFKEKQGTEVAKFYMEESSMDIFDGIFRKNSFKT